MTQSEQILAGFKKILKSKGLTYKDLSKKADLSESSIKRILSSSTIDLMRLESFCEIAEVSFAEVFKIAENIGPTLRTSFTPKQEAALARDSRLLHFFLLIFESVSLNRIIRDYVITWSEVDHFLLELDKVDILELHANRRFRFLMDKNARFHKDGPIGKRMLEVSRQDFLNHSFHDENSFIRLAIFRANPFQLEKLKIKVEKLVRDVLDDSDTMPLYDEGHNIGLLVSFRPWQFNEYQSIKRRRSNKD